MGIIIIDELLQFIKIKTNKVYVLLRVGALIAATDVF